MSSLSIRNSWRRGDEPEAAISRPRLSLEVCKRIEASKLRRLGEYDVVNPIRGGFSGQRVFSWVTCSEKSS